MTQPPIEPRLSDVDPGDEVSLLLTDARARAQSIIDESLERAQELLRGEPAPQAFERLRRTVNDMAVDVRAIHSRLDEIEALIRGVGVAYRAPGYPPVAPPPVYAAAPVYAPAPPVYYAPAPAPAPTPPPAPVYAPQPEAPTPPPPPAPPVYEAPHAPVAPPAAYVPPVEVPAAVVSTPPTEVAAAPAPPPPPVQPAPTPVPPPAPAPSVPEPELFRSEAPPASAIPPQRPVAPPEPVTPPPPAPIAPPASPRFEEPIAPPAPPMAEAPAPTAPPIPMAPAAAPEPAATEGFDPEGGAIALRVSPVAGFQGLMRVQDALGRCRGVREAGVEAYAQGEARLRLHLSDRTSGEQLARALGEILGRGARVTSESIAERSIQLALE